MRIQAMPKVSVILPVYNASKYVLRALSSLKAQTIENFEVLIVDDSSSDSTVTIVNKFIQGDDRFKLIALKENGGPSRARNAALQEAKGDWIALLDADDAYLSMRLERLIDIAEKERLDLIADNQIVYDSVLGREVGLDCFNSGKELQILSFDAFVLGSGSRLSLCKVFTQEARPHMPLLKFLFKREFMSKHQIFYRPDLRMGEDFDIYARCLIHGARAGIVPEAFYIYTTSYNPRAGTKSLTSKTKFDMAPVIKSIDSLIAEYGARLDIPSLQALESRRRDAEERQTYEELKEMISKKRWSAALWAVVYFPRLALFILNAIIYKVKQKFAL